MPLQPGQLLLHYRIGEKIGAGGMGEVWRARDGRLDRDVALKILPGDFAADPDRVARFQREARVLASLSHPHIAAVHGFEEAEGVRFLVLELVQGEDLSARLSRGPLPVDEAVEIARQIAAALGEAHEKGIVHRDLKPGNVKLTPDGKAKVLDFGLAKAWQGETGAASGRGVDLSLSPTMTFNATQAGIILGTAAYMAPEQARGRPVDRRADIWAYGVVLFEMLTGRQLFRGETVSDVLAGVLKTVPDWSSLPTDVPAPVRALLRRCLAKAPEERLRDIGDVRLFLEDGLGEEPAGAAAASSRSTLARALPLLGAAVAGAAVAALGLMALRGETARSPAPSPTRLTVTLPPDAPYEVGSYPGHSLTISRDGRSIVYRPSGDGPLRIRDLSDLAIRPIPETESGNQPFFSPDGSWLAYFGESSLKKVRLAGGRPVTLVPDLPNANWQRGSWSDDGRIVFDTWNSGLRVVSADGGTPAVLTSPGDEWHLAPCVIPGTTSVLFFAQTRASLRIEAIPLDGGEIRTVLEDASHPLYLSSGHLLFVRQGGVMIAPFSPETLEVTGPTLPVPFDVMVDHPNVSAPVPQLAVSATGTLVYAPGQNGGLPDSTLFWVDREGRRETIGTVPFAWPHFDLDRDDRRVILSGRSQGAVRYGLYDLDRKSFTPLMDMSMDYPASPVFSPDGARIYYPRFGTHESEIMTLPLDGGKPESLGQLTGTWASTRSISGDGRYLAVSVYHPETGSDIWYLDLQGGGEPRPFLVTPDNEYGPVLSPDGDWLVYASGESGGWGSYMRRFPGGEGKVRITTENCSDAAWSPDGRQIFLECSVELGMRVLVASVDPGPPLRLGRPTVLFEGEFAESTDAGSSFTLSSDGSRLLLASRAADYRRADRLVVVQDWLTEVGQMTSP